MSQEPPPDNWVAPDPASLAAFLPNDRCQPLGYVVAVKFLDEAGDVGLHTSWSGGIARWEAVGMAEFLKQNVFRPGYGDPMDGQGD